MEGAGAGVGEGNRNRGLNVCLSQLLNEGQLRLSVEECGGKRGVVSLLKGAFVPLRDT